VIGQTVARYRILEKLGQGGMGVVYKAEDLSLKRNVALKFIRPGRETAGDVVERFKREAQAAAALNHPNIVAVYDIGEHEGQFYISMEFVPGTNLKKIVAAQGGLTTEQAFGVGLEIAAGLQAIHEVGIIHRDLRAQNIMLDSRGVVRIMDFGMSKEWGTQATAIGMVMGSPEYMSPEQAEGQRVGFATDVYALGAILDSLVSGQAPRALEAMLTIAPPRPLAIR